MAKKRYSQTIKMKDTDGVEATVLLSETRGGHLYVQMWAAPKTNLSAVSHSLMLAAQACTDHPYVRETLEMCISFSLAKLVEGGFQVFPEGQATPSDDLPF